MMFSCIWPGVNAKLWSQAQQSNPRAKKSTGKDTSKGKENSLQLFCPKRSEREKYKSIKLESTRIGQADICLSIKFWNTELKEIINITLMVENIN